MTTKRQIEVALIAMAGGLGALGLFWLIARPEATNTSVLIGTLIYAAAYVLVVPRAEGRLAPDESAQLEADPVEEPQPVAHV
jgi:hypothetical protein